LFGGVEALSLARLRRLGDVGSDTIAPHQDQEHGDVRNQYPSHDRCQAHG
jgi:hypothetical protein